jgi:hypothetical protein
VLQTQQIAILLTPAISIRSIMYSLTALAVRLGRRCGSPRKQLLENPTDADGGSDSPHTQPAEACCGTSLPEEMSAEIAASKSRTRQSPRQVVA